MKKLLLLGLIITSLLPLRAQDNTDESLAFQYYRNGEYDKAAALFEKLYQKNANSDAYYRYLFNSLLYIRAYDDLEKIVKKNLKNNPGQLTYQADLGYLYIQQGNVSKGKSEYDQSIKSLQPNDAQIVQLANALVNYEERELAVEVYEKGRKLIGNSYLFALELAELYRQLNNTKSTIGEYLNYLDMNVSNLNDIKGMLQPVVQNKAFADELRNQLLSRIQKYPQVVTYAELLIWHYNQQKSFKASMIQSKALDKRLKENGYRLMNLARLAVDEREYDIAQEAFDYVIEKGNSNVFYLKAKQEGLDAHMKKIFDNVSYTQDDLQSLSNRFDRFIEEFGVNRNTATTIRDKAKFLALYLNNLDEAITLLSDLINNPQVEKKLKGEFKLELGDFHIMNGDVWEAALLYGQVDKDFIDEPLGEMARFKNAKLSYYIGEFEWSQAQLNILKASTSELVANDALKLSVFIMDHLGLDTTTVPMMMFARADLLFFQNQTEQAERSLDSLLNVYPDHGLTDDVYFMKAHIAMKRHNFEAAAGLYQKIIAQYPDEILGDDATFKLAELYDHVLNDPEKAQELYKELIFNYTDSIYIVEARKRFRQLRGDQL